MVVDLHACGASAGRDGDRYADVPLGRLGVGHVVRLPHALAVPEHDRVRVAPAEKVRLLEAGGAHDHDLAHHVLRRVIEPQRDRALHGHLRLLAAVLQRQRLRRDAQLIVPLAFRLQHELRLPHEIVRVHLQPTEPSVTRCRLAWSMIG